MSANDDVKRTETGDPIPPKPSRPFTCYNVFSILERAYIIQTHEKYCVDLPERADVDGGLRPEKYRGLILPENWYVVGVNRKKRKDHKTHGVISFSDLSNAIAENWRTVDDETRAYCQYLADLEIVRYRKDLSAYIEKYGEEAAKTPRKKRKKKHNPEAAAKSTVNSETGAAAALGVGGDDDQDDDEAYERELFNMYSLANPSAAAAAAAAAVARGVPVNEDMDAKPPALPRSDQDASAHTSSETQTSRSTSESYTASSSKSEM